MGAVIDQRRGQEHSLTPFNGAGTAKPIDWIHRDEGNKITSAALVDDADAITNASAGTTAVISAQVSGIAGYTKYQGQIVQVVIPL